MKLTNVHENITLVAANCFENAGTQKIKWREVLKFCSSLCRTCCV